MLSIHGVPLLLQVGVPLALIGWQVFARDRSVGGWLTKTAIVMTYLTAAHFAGLWVVLPWYTAIMLLLGTALMVLRQLPRIQRLPWRTDRLSWRASVGRGALATVAALAIQTTLAGRRIPAEQVINLEFPLRDGIYQVVNGGSTELVNAHLMTLSEERFRPYRGQSYGVDLVKIEAFGLRADGPLPADPARYAVYADRVYAPCSGVVVQAKDGFPDMRPPQPDRTEMAGNYVLLNCGGVHVLLGHLRPGSVRVRPSESVTSGTQVGLVGNSGNSNEPHLHIHAQRPAHRIDEPLSGDPLPIRFTGRYVVRNDRIESR